FDTLYDKAFVGKSEKANHGASKNNTNINFHVGEGIDQSVPYTLSLFSDPNRKRIKLDACENLQVNNHPKTDVAYKIDGKGRDILTYYNLESAEHNAFSFDDIFQVSLGTSFYQNAMPFPNNALAIVQALLKR